MKSGSSWLNALQYNPLDFAEMDHLDPTLKDGHRVLFDRTLNIHVRFQDRYSDIHEISNPEPINIRVLQLVLNSCDQGSDYNPQSVKMEISSDKDLFFLFYHEATSNTFNNIKIAQGLQMPFKDYSSIIIATLNKVENNLNGYAAVYSIMLDGSARLEINQATEFKSINMIYFDFHTCEEQFLRQSIIFKYNQQRKSIKYLTQQVQESKLKTTGTFK